MTEIRDQSIPREERVLLAVKAYQQGQFDSAHKAATAYDVLNRQSLLDCAGKVHQASWYEADVPKDWQIAVSDKGWTSDDLGLYWLKAVFDPYTRRLTVGTRRLLILDGHGSHVTPEFDNLWMSGAFAFENDIWAECSREDARRVNHIDKEDFLLLYIEARRQALSRRTSEVDSWPQAFPIQSDPGSVTVTSSG
ncbi:DDE superfamily endonuclease [Hirsutella rhossiliensis]